MYAVEGPVVSKGELRSCISWDRQLVSDPGVRVPGRQLRSRWCEAARGGKSVSRGSAGEIKDMRCGEGLRNRPALVR